MKLVKWFLVRRISNYILKLMMWKSGYRFRKNKKSIAELSENNSTKECKSVMKYIADQANLRQRKLVGLDK